MTHAAEQESATPSWLWILAGGLCCAVLVSCIAQVITGPVNTDAGYYIPHALLVLGGEIPYRDFPSGYAPGFYYLLALLGETGLRTPIVYKTFIFAIQIANSVLVYAVLRRMHNGPGLSFWFAACFAGLTTAAWGIAVQHEPVLNLLIIGAFWILLRAPHPARGAAAGLALGGALMIKQYAVLAVPALMLACLIPLAQSRTTASAGIRSRGGAQLACMLLTAPIPYFVFLAATGLHPVENLVHLMTFGGSASSYGQWNFAATLGFLIVDPVGRFLLPTLVLAVWLLLRSDSWRVRVLSLGLGLSLLPLFVLPIAYYLQPTLPWSIFIMAEFSRAVGARFQQSGAATTIAAMVITLPLVGIIGYGSKDALNPPTSLSDQLEITAMLEDEIGSFHDVLILNGSWLYALSSFVPPLKDYAFNIDPEKDDLRRAQTRFAIILSGPGPVTYVRAWLEDGGMNLRRQISWRNGTIYVLDREPRSSPRSKNRSRGARSPVHRPDRPRR